MELGSDEALREVISINFERLRKDMMQFIKDFESSVDDYQKSIYLPHVQELEGKYHELKSVYDEFETGTDTGSRELARLEDIYMKLVNRSSKLHQRVRNHNLLSRAFTSWVNDGTERKIAYDTFKSIYIYNALKRVYFRRWVRMMHRKRHQRLETEARLRYEREVKAKSSEYNSQIARLEKELSNARSELESKQKSFKEMQERLKKAFMRGVVNLNLEAMDVFNGAQFMNLTEEVENAENAVRDDEAEIEEGDEEFFVEEEPKVSVIRHDK